MIKIPLAILLSIFLSNFGNADEKKCTFPVMTPSIEEISKGNFDLSFKSEKDFFFDFNDKITKTENLAKENNHDLGDMMNFYATQAVEHLEGIDFRKKFENLCAKNDSSAFNSNLEKYFECYKLAINKFPNSVFTSSNIEKIKKAYPRCKLDNIDTCINLGFKKGTDGLKNCVLELNNE